MIKVKPTDTLLPEDRTVVNDMVTELRATAEKLEKAVTYEDVTKSVPDPVMEPEDTAKDDFFERMQIVENLMASEEEEGTPVTAAEGAESHEELK